MSLGFIRSRLSRSSTPWSIPLAAHSAVAMTSIIITSGGVPATIMLTSFSMLQGQSRVLLTRTRGWSAWKSSTCAIISGSRSACQRW